MRDPRDGFDTPTLPPLWAVAVITVLALAVLAAWTSPAQAAPQRGTVAYCKKHAVGVARRACIVRVTFQPLGAEGVRKALRVAWCESRFDPRAKNGQFRGMFQVSDAWRRDVPGYGTRPEQQARHALGVVTHPEGGWTHWECR